MKLQALVAISRQVVAGVPDKDDVCAYGVWDQQGGNEIKLFGTKEEAEAAFGARFEALTGHAWHDRLIAQRSIQQQAAGNAVAGRYLYLPTNHEAVLEQQKHVATGSELLSIYDREEIFPKTGVSYFRLAAAYFLFLFFIFLVDLLGALSQTPGPTERRLFDLLAFVSNKNLILGFCNRYKLTVSTCWLISPEDLPL